MKRAYSPREIARKTYKVLPWGGRWEEAFGQPKKTPRGSSVVRVPAARAHS